MSFRHNKKRNVGLVYEFLVRHLSSCVLEGNDAGINKVKALIAKHFNQNTDLGQELLVFKALYESKVSSVEAAKALVGRAKKACEQQSQARLDLEKTGLIHEINTCLQDASFFDRPVKDYRLLASIQILMNEWRSANLVESVNAESVELEQRLIEHLTRDDSAALQEAQQKLDAVKALTTNDVDKLALKIFFDKFNKKYGSVLNEEQKKILAAYVTEKPIIIKQLLENVNQTLEPELEKGAKTYANNPTVVEKINKTKKLLESYKEKLRTPETMITEEVMEFYLKAVNLKAEFSSEEK